jgi:hypothetical protein
MTVEYCDPEVVVVTVPLAAVVVAVVVAPAVAGGRVNCIFGE